MVKAWQTSLVGTGEEGKGEGRGRGGQGREEGEGMGRGGSTSLREERGHVPLAPHYNHYADGAECSSWPQPEEPRQGCRQAQHIIFSLEVFSGDLVVKPQLDNFCSPLPGTSFISTPRAGFSFR